MLRIFFTDILLFFVPLILYVIGTWSVARWVERRGKKGPRIRRAVLFWLTLMALLAVSVSLLVGVALRQQGMPEDTYIPPHMENGVLVPGGFQ